MTSSGIAPPEKLSERLAEQLLAQIRSGALKAHDRLPTEQALAEQHGVSRTVVREAVSRLKSTGLLVSRQGSGVYVSPHSEVRHLNFDPQVLASLESVLEVVEVRRALEGEVAALAAERAGKRDVQRLEAALKAIDKAVQGGGDGVEEDLRFHRAIAQAARNTQFTRFLGFIEQYVCDAMRVTRSNEAQRSDFSEAVRAEHRNIVQAIAAGDAEAARSAARSHMDRAEARIQDADAPIRRALRELKAAPARTPRATRARA